MWWSFCSPKAGLGTSVVAVATALQLAKAQPSSEVIVADFGGDQPDLLGVDASGRSGIVDWLGSGPDVSTDALRHLLVDVAPGVALLPRGVGRLANNIDPHRCFELARAFPRSIVIADLGALEAEPTFATSLIAAKGHHTTVVVRACYLALRRASGLPVEFESVVEVVEPGRALSSLDVELVLNRPVTTRIRIDPAIARVVDAGLLAARPPRHLRRAIKSLIDQVGPLEVATLDAAVMS